MVDFTHVALDEPTARVGQTAPSNRGLVVVSGVIFFAGSVLLWQTESLTQVGLFLVAGVLGVALYFARYGFTSSFRNFLRDQRGIGIRAQMVMFLTANLLFLPLMTHGRAFGHTVGGYVFPVGISVAAGSFLFGIGMQLADGCASGTLYHTGGGDLRGVAAIAGFVVGSVAGSVNFPWWMATPHFSPISFVASFGTIGGFVVEGFLLVVVFLLAWWLERRRYGHVEPLFSALAPHRNRAGRFDPHILFKGPWSWIAGGLVLAVGNWLVLLLSGKPWGVTFAFALWGAKITQALGIPVAHWTYWQVPANAVALRRGILHDATTVLDIGVILGAFLAASLAGGFSTWKLPRIPGRMWVALVGGGALMGYGARIAFGCNIGAFFSGIASFSLHGWEWFLFALMGSLVGLLCRPAFGFRR